MRLPSRQLICLLAVAVVAVPSGTAWAQDADPAAETSPEVSPSSLPSSSEILTMIDKATEAKPEEETDNWSAPVRLAIVFSILALLPSLLVMVTSFTRIVIVLAFVRRALTTQNIPPTIAIIGLGLFLTLFTMMPTINTINETGLQPYLNDELTFPEFVDRSQAALKEFMYKQTHPEDIQLFLNLSKSPKPKTLQDIPSIVMIPAFAISEFRKAFEMGALLFIPFLLIDLVAAGILLSAGMMMLPPVMISLPFKIILFVLVDGWGLLARTLVTSFH